MDGNQLIPLESINAVEVFKGKSLDELLERIRSETVTIVPDVSTAGGRKEIASLAYKVARSKTTIDEAGKSLVSEWKQKSAEVDAARKKARDYLDALKDEVRKPLDEWEAEQARLEREAAEAAERQRREAEEAARAELARREAEIAEREAAIAAKEKEAADRIAAERAEAERLARDEQIRREAAERAEREASEAIARAERKAAEARERELRAAERAEQERVEAAARAEREKAEAVRQAEARAAEEAARKERERLAEEARVRADEERKAANRRHRAKINNEVVASLTKAGHSEELAKAIVTLIASGQVAHATINY